MDFKEFSGRVGALHVKSTTMVNTLFGWSVIGPLVIAFIAFGSIAVRAMGIVSSAPMVAKICFSVAGMIFLIKFETWISSQSYELKWRIIVAFVIFAVVGLGWVLSWHWIDIMEKGIKEKEARQAYTGRLQAEKKTIFSAKDNIYPELEIGDSGTVLVYEGPQSEPLFEISKDNAIKIELVEGQIQVSAGIINRNGQLIAEIINNKWKVNKNNTWDRNYSKNALEVRDSTGDIVLQVRLVDNNRVQFQAKLFNSDGIMVCLISEGPGKGAFIGFNTEDKIQPIFKYPSELHFGEFVETK